ncbi:hypothetical protein [Priestia abyssalis]|uniref:hypothetical protein n=1 Tax=Priestia abyssalis TaxID=1221450 RepID=UPI000994D3EA|nr:hypothetical protein [Priestia abyssalis]
MLYILATLFFLFGGIGIFYFNWEMIKTEFDIIKKDPNEARSWFLILLEIGTLNNLSGLFGGLVMTLIGIGIPIFFIVAMLL